VDQMMSFSNFSQSTLADCVELFITEFMIMELQKPISYKQEMFGLIYKQLLSTEIDSHQFKSIFNLLLNS